MVNLLFILYPESNYLVQQLRLLKAVLMRAEREEKERCSERISLLRECLSDSGHNLEEMLTTRVVLMRSQLGMKNMLSIT